MEWFQLYVRDLSNRLLSAATSAAVGAWVRMLAHCYRLENGGCYEHCSEHSTRQWMSIASVDRGEVDDVVKAGLATWEGDALRIHGFDLEQQAKATKRKEKGREMALVRWGHAPSIAGSNAKERRGDEKKEKEIKDPPIPPVGGKRARMEVSPGFADFWAAYPRRVGRGAAERAWPGDDQLPAMLAALTWQAATWSDPRYIPHPATWLRGKRWLDERPAASPTRPRNIRHGYAEPSDFGDTPIGRIEL